MSVELLEAVARFFRSFPKVARVYGHKANSVSRWWQRATTEHELRWLSDRYLPDIGVARRDIRRVARAPASATAEPQTTQRSHVIRANLSVPELLEPLVNPWMGRSSTKLSTTTTSIGEVQDA